MSLLYFVIAVIVIVGPISFIGYYKNKADKLAVEKEILKRRNETLEERFEKEDEQAHNEQPFVLSAQQTTGVEIMQSFAQSRQVDLDTDEDSCNENFESYRFSFQGGTFQCFAGKQTDEILLRYYYFYELPLSDNAFIRVLRLCNDYTKNCRYAKLVYSTHENEAGEEIIAMHFCYEMIGVHLEGLEYLLTHNFMLVRGATEALDTIRQEEEALCPADNKNSKTEADYQAMAIRMAMSRDNK